MVIDYIASGNKSTTSTVAYWYFDYLNAEDLHPQRFCATLLKQLVDKSMSEISLEVKELYQRYKNNSSGKYPEVPDVLQALIPLIKVEMPFIVIDALDECSKAHFKAILNIVAQLQDHGARIFVTSRPHIECPPDKAIVWHKIEIQAHADDLRRLVSHRIESKFQSRMRLITEDLKDEIADTIVKKTQGMFLWASLQLDAILTGVSKARIRKNLRNMPGSVQEVFEKTVCRMDDNGFAKRTLLWLAYAKEPLDFLAVAHGVVMEVYDEGDIEESEEDEDDFDEQDIPTIEELMEACCGLVSMEGDRKLRIAHYSIQEYFEKTSSALEPLTEEHLARSCLAYLALPVFRDGYQDSEKKAHWRMKRFPLYLYAATKWRHHTAHDAQSPEIERAVLKIYSHPGLFSSYSQIFYYRRAFYYEDNGMYRTTGGDIFGFQIGFTPLHNATELCLSGVVRRLLDGGWDPSCETLDRTTPLHLAVRENDEELVKMLLDFGANRLVQGQILPPRLWKVSADAWEKYWKKSGHYGNSASLPHYPIVFALAVGSRNLISMLHGDKLELEVAVDALGMAARLANHDLLERILTEYPEIDHRHPAFIQTFHPAFIQTFSDIPPGADNLTRLLLKHRPQVDDQDGVLTLLLSRAAATAPDLVALLLDKGADVNGGTQHSMPLLAALSRGNKAAAILLVERGADLSDGGLLTQAVFCNNPRRIEALLGYYNDSSSRESPGCSAIENASRSVDVEVLSLLLDRGADINGTNLDGLTALGEVALDGDVEMAKILLDHGANPDVDGQICTPMMFAAQNGHEDFVTLLLDHRADINFINQCNRVGRETALDSAVSSECEGMCRSLLFRGADPNPRGASQPLAVAVRGRRMNLLELLLESGANPCLKSRNGTYPLEIAVAHGWEDGVITLLERGATIHTRGGFYPSILHAAAESENNNMVRIMLDYGAAVTKDDENNDGLLNVAKYSHQLLIDHGANVNSSGRHGTPLQAVIASANYSYLEEDVLEVVTILIRSGANVNKTGGRYGFPLQAAARHGYEAVVDTLLEHGASPRAVGGRYGSALQAAAYIGNEAIAGALIKHGANVNEAGGIYGTPLQAAAFAGHEAIVRLLLDSGADLGLRGGRYHNPLRAAKKGGTPQSWAVTRILSEHGAVDDSIPTEASAVKTRRPPFFRGDSEAESSGPDSLDPESESKDE